MTEQQLRDVLKRVVPEPPDTVADPGPVIKTARRHRRTRAAGMVGLAALLVAGTAVGIRAFGEDERHLVADRPPVAIADPYTTAPCPALADEWPSTLTADLAGVTAVRYCGRPFNGFPTAAGAPDALVTGIAGFRSDVADVREANPARCSAVDVVPSDSRLLLQLDDGSFVGVPAGPCQDIVIDGRSLDSFDVTLAFVDALRAQRDAHDYALVGEPPPLGCAEQNDVSPAAPGDEVLVEAVVCSGDRGDAVQLGAEALAALDEAWGQATVMDRQGVTECDAEIAATTIQARTDRGDTVTIRPGSDIGDCDRLAYTSWLVPLPVEQTPGSSEVMLPAYALPIGVDDLAGQHRAE